MFSIDCPKCEVPIEFSLGSDEPYPGRVVAVVDEWKRDCSCVFSEVEEEELCRRAVKSIEDQDPPGDY